MTTPLIEAIARAIAEGQGDDFDHAHRDKPHWIETRGEAGGRYRDINEPRQPDFLDAAQAALTAITEAGYAVVPTKPDLDTMLGMMKAANEADCGDLTITSARAALAYLIAAQGDG